MGSSSSCGADVCSLPGSRGDGGAMMRDSYVHRQQNPPVLESMEIVVALVLMAVCWFAWRSEEHTSELQSLRHLVCRLLLEKKTRNTCPTVQCHTLPRLALTLADHIPD